MKQLNLIPIENFLEKSRIAIRSNQKNLTLSIQEITDLQASISVLLSKLLTKAELDKVSEKIEIKMDGGKF
jgi:hypothetical protein